MSWRTIYITESERLSLYLDSLMIIKNGEEYKIPLKDIGSIILEDNRTSLTVKLMNKITEYNILLIFCDDKYNPTTMIFPLNSYFRQYKIVEEQINWDNNLKKLLWKEIVKVKLENQKEILKKLKKIGETTILLDKYISEVKENDLENREGLGAKIYFRELFGENFIRGNNDVVNSALNYGYTIFNSKISRIIASKGLLTYLGIHHKNEYNQFNLASDIIEVFRPIIDYYVFLNIKESEYFSREDRIELINLLNSKIKYNSYMETVYNSMEKYIEFIIEFFKTGKFNKNKMPYLEIIEFYEL
ncbi:MULTISPECIES: type II CRISPR-associated endonuclease Cas1 [Fusobacterium]|uniref:type II CRISPR-associated endonuclease Cas1 n=1 Tax=Fusobacterium TaxID=848 RepID=UPI001477787A|nr:MULTISPECIES: type II CRISPR-associated endonuclease Cas1 [Fusobacterium]NME36156.1 type II CRISPR-associated endonuclease Cas1 [Fusobacterium sp. FSA-380-WT-3A]